MPRSHTSMTEKAAAACHAFHATWIQRSDHGNVTQSTPTPPAAKHHQMDAMEDHTLPLQNWTATPVRQLGAILSVILVVFATAATHDRAQADTAKPIRIVAFGDSLIAGYGLSLKDAFPAQLSAALKAEHPNVEIINAGVSGDTTAAALARLDWAFPPDADAAIVLLGGNDFLRGLSPKQMNKNLDTILTKLKARNLQVLLLGMKAARNTGKSYYEPFDATFPTLAKKHDTLLDPFFLDGIAGTRTYNQIDAVSYTHLTLPTKA